MAKLTALIEERDNYEIVEDEIAAILKVESSNQEQLATASGKDPREWRLHVFQGRTNPWPTPVAEFLEQQEDFAPLVHVSWNQDSIDLSSSNLVERQKHDATYWIDCYGYGVAKETNEGHDPGDFVAQREAYRAARLARKILMSAEYAYLGLPRGENQVVWRRWFSERQLLPVEIDEARAVHARVVRLSFRVEFSEFSPQIVGQIIELVSLQCKRAVTGELLFQADYQL
jgi:hypothetical protein